MGQLKVFHWHNVMCCGISRSLFFKPIAVCVVFKDSAPVQLQGKREILSSGSVPVNQEKSLSELVLEFDSTP